MKKVLLVVVLVLSATMLFSEEKIEERGFYEKRGFYFDVGFGFAYVKYPEPLNSEVVALEALGCDRMTLYANGSIGGAVSDKSYLLGSISYYSDELEYGSILWGDFLYLDTYLYAIGVRYYPFTTGVVLGADVGVTNLVFTGTDSSDVESDYGFGYNLLFVYDFDTTKTGFALQLGLKVGVYDIESDGDTVRPASLFVNFVWK